MSKSTKNALTRSGDYSDVMYFWNNLGPSDILRAINFAGYRRITI